jgi:CBS domain-containing protein
MTTVESPRGTRKVRDVMTRDVASVHGDTPLTSALAMLRSRNVSAVPVLDRSGIVVGVVSETDVLHAQRQRPPGAGEPTAAEVMTSPAVTVGPEASVVEAARLMDRIGVKRLPVVGDSGRLIGSASRHDVLMVVLRSDAAIAAEILGKVLRGALHVGPPQVEVEVRDGVVTLAGLLEHKSELDGALVLARAVDGVVAVDNRLRYRYDDTSVAQSTPAITDRYSCS